MRRKGVVALLLVCALGVPSRAEADFWEWLDNLSGPRFVGVQGELRVWCTYDNVLLKLKRDSERLATTMARRFENERAMPSAPYWAAGVSAAVTSATFANAALDLEAAAETTGDNFNSRPLVTSALSWWEMARANRSIAEASNGTIAAINSVRAKLPIETVTTDAKLAADRDLADKVNLNPLVTIIPVSGLPVGASGSICDLTDVLWPGDTKAKPYDRVRHSIKFTYAFGREPKTPKENRDRFRSFGATYHWAGVKSLEFGAGGGIARFKSPPADDWFQKPFVEAFVDFRPGAVVANDQFRNPWWQAAYLRFGVMTFPGGFEAGRFSGPPGPSPEYGTELIRKISIFADLEPPFRAVFKRWR